MHCTERKTEQKKLEQYNSKNKRIIHLLTVHQQIYNLHRRHTQTHTYTHTHTQTHTHTHAHTHAHTRSDEKCVCPRRRFRQGVFCSLARARWDHPCTTYWRAVVWDCPLTLTTVSICTWTVSIRESSTLTCRSLAMHCLIWRSGQSRLDTSSSVVCWSPPFKHKHVSYGQMKACVSYCQA